MIDRRRKSGFPVFGGTGRDVTGQDCGFGCSVRLGPVRTGIGGLPGGDGLNAVKDAARGALGELTAEITIHTRTFVADYSTNDRYTD